MPTPIGNLGDVTMRALEVLRTVDGVLAEDTRTSGRLLAHYEIKTQLIPYHAHNEHKVTDRLVEEMKGGKHYALVTDAGSPGISDPGFLLTRAALQADLSVEALPGATAFVPALTASGLPADRFVFEGFLPVKKGRQTRLKFLAPEERTMIFYESPHRIRRTLEDLSGVMGAGRPAAIGRELTKLHEEMVRGTLEELIAYFAQREPRGEFVLIVAGADA